MRFVTNQAKWGVNLGKCSPGTPNPLYLSSFGVTLSLITNSVQNIKSHCAAVMNLTLLNLFAPVQALR